MAHIDPQHRGMTAAGYPIAVSFDDTTTVSVLVDAAQARKLHWDWHYSADYEQPYNGFWVEVVDKNGVVTPVIPVASTSPPAGLRVAAAHVSWPDAAILHTRSDDRSRLELMDGTKDLG